VSFAARILRLTLLSPDNVEAILIQTEVWRRLWSLTTYVSDIEPHQDAA